MTIELDVTLDEENQMEGAFFLCPVNSEFAT